MTQIDDSVAPDTGRPTVFFSYSRNDRARAVPIIRALEQSGIDVWWDGLLEGGAKYIENTERALHEADAVVVLWSKHSIDSHWVQDEAMYGRDQRRLVPLSIDQVEPPLGFRQFQLIDLSKWDGDDKAPAIRNIIRTVEAIRGKQGAAPELLQETLLERLSRRRILVMGAALLGGSVATLAAVRPWQRDAKRVADGSILVLPFENDSPDSQQDYLSSGLANELRNALARNNGLKVMARSSSEDVKERRLTPQSISRELGVAFVVEGSVQVINGIVSVSSSLIEGASELTVWSDSFRQPLEGLLDMQTQIVEAISAELTLGMSTAIGTANIGAATNAEAFDSYLRGWTIYRGSNSKETDLLALERFDTAIRLDPGFAAAHAARSATYTLLGHTSDSRAQAQAYYQTAVEAANRAVELGPDLDEAHSVLALAMFETQLKIREARPAYERSLELGRGSAVIQARYAEYASLTGRHTEALEAIAFGIALDPLNATIYRSKSLIHYAAGRYAEAIAAGEEAISLNASVSDVQAWMALAHLQLGDLDRALETGLKEPHSLTGDPAVSVIYHRMGDAAQSEAALERLIEEYGSNGLYQQAQVRAQQGRLDLAMDVLAQALEYGDAGLTYLYTDPLMEPLRGREDFIRLQNQLGFT
ncbi:MAG: hypothetical protein Hens2KO_09070 [Henriciella sp.]